ncbi:hypothetical protein Trydic_g5454 [Trypoxylus dichotomus]
MDRDHEKFTDVINKQVHTEYRNTINVQETTIEELQNIIKCLEGRKAPGHDRITNTAIKHLTLEAVDTLKEIINAIIRHQHYPKTWKHATIIIIHKSGKPKNKTDGYRPISLLPGLSIILERVIETRLLSVVEQKSIIPGFQFGFRREYSTTKQLLRMSEHITSNMDKSTPTAAIKLDIEKAFDKVWHDGLIYKRYRKTYFCTQKDLVRGDSYLVDIIKYGANTYPIVSIKLVETIVHKMSSILAYPRETISIESSCDHDVLLVIHNRSVIDMEDCSVRIEKKTFWPNDMYLWERKSLCYLSSTSFYLMEQGSTTKENRYKSSSTLRLPDYFNTSQPNKRHKIAATERTEGPAGLNGVAAC